MRTEPVGSGNRSRFVEYCARYGREHDESYLPGDDFVFSSDGPAYVLMDGDSVVGAVSLLRTQSYVDARKGRFVVFHSLVPSAARYSELYRAIGEHFDGLDKVYLFVPRDKEDVVAALGALGFRPERMSFVLVLPQPEERQADLADGFSILPVSREDRAALQAFADVMNLNFGDSAGHVEATADVVRGWFEGDGYVERGLALLYSGELPIGTACLFRDEDGDSGVIEFLSVLEGFRGRGLGRQLLRHQVNLARASGLTSLCLVVNGENDSAIALYLSEGFELEETVVCYSRAV